VSLSRLELRCTNLRKKMPNHLSRRLSLKSLWLLRKNLNPSLSTFLRSLFKKNLNLPKKRRQLRSLRKTKRKQKSPPPNPKLHKLLNQSTLWQHSPL